MIPIYDDQPVPRYPVATSLIIAINIIVFVFWQLPTGLARSVQIGGFIPSELFHQSYLTALTHIFSSMFMHGGWLHIISNMWFLWIFGRTIEWDTGPIRFLTLYLFCGIIADVVFIIFSGPTHIPLVGASGAIAGILGAYFAIHPGARIATLVPIFIIFRVMIPAWFFLILWIVLQFLSESARETALTHSHHHHGGVAYLAHIGGFFTGVTSIFFFKKRD